MPHNYSSITFGKTSDFNSSEYFSSDNYIATYGGCKCHLWSVSGVLYTLQLFFFLSVSEPSFLQHKHTNTSYSTKKTWVLAYFIVLSIESSMKQWHITRVIGSWLGSSCKYLFELWGSNTKGPFFTNMGCLSQIQHHMTEPFLNIKIL